MASPAVTYSTFPAGSTADGTQVSQNFSDVINGITDSTKSLSINALTLAGALTLPGSSSADASGNMILGGNLTINGGTSIIIPSTAGYTWTGNNEYISANTATHLMTFKTNGATQFTIDTSGNGVLTGKLTAANILDSGLSASQAVFSDSSKNLVSNAITGSGSVVMSASPTLTGTIIAASATLSGTLTSSGLLAYGVTYDASTTGTVNALSVTKSVIELNASTTITLNGIVAGAAGQRLLINNITGNTMTINDNNAGASAANQIHTGTGAPITVPNNATVELIYLLDTSRWYVIGKW